MQQSKESGNVIITFDGKDGSWLPTSWKTYLSGIIAAAPTFVLWAPTVYPTIHFPPMVMAIAAFVQMGGIVAMGRNAKDYNVTGGTIGQPSTPSALTVANQEASTLNPPVPKV